MVDLPVQHVQQVPRGAGIDPGGLQHLHRGADRGQRIAQLVRQGGEEFVLAPIGFGERYGALLKLFEQAGALRGKLFDPELLLPYGTAQYYVGNRRLDGVAYPGIGKALDQVVLGPLLQGLHRQRLVALPGQHDDRRRLLAEFLLQFLQELQAVQVRQVVVEQHAVRAFGAAAREAFAAGAGFRNEIGTLVPGLEVAPERQPVLPAVVDDQDAAAARRSLRVEDDHLEPAVLEALDGLQEVRQFTGLRT